MLFYSYILLSSLKIFTSVSSELQSHTNRSDYYKCLFTKEPIVCEYGEICRLRSSSHCESWNRTVKERPTTSFWYRQDGIQRKVFDDEQTLTDIKTGDLIFFQVTHNEQGGYAEWRPIANSTGSYWKDPTCGEIHLTVVTDNDNYRYPLYYENNLGVVVNEDDISKDSGQLIVWNEWNECQCTGLEYRFRTGDCILTKPLDSKYPHLNGIFKQYSNRIPCFSSLLPVNYSKDHNLRNFVLYADCEKREVECKSDVVYKSSEASMKLNRVNQYRTELDLPEVLVIRVRRGQRVVLACPRVYKNKFSSLSLSRWDMSWNVETQINGGKFYIDRLYRLVVEKIDPNDIETNLTCFYGSEPAIIYIIDIYKNNPDNIHKYLSFFSAYFMVFNLILVILLSLFIKEKKIQINV